MNKPCAEAHWEKGGLPFGAWRVILTASTMAAKDSITLPEGPGTFQPTRWSRILAAADSESPRHDEHLAELCRIYWRPIYHFVRSRGLGAHEAEDLTQEFLAQVATGRILKVADPLKGRFRSFLLKCCKNFLLNAHKRESALKRGGGHQIVSLDESMEHGSGYDPAGVDSTPDEIFDRQWALALLRRVLDRLETFYREDGRGEMFKLLKGTLTAEPLDETYVQIGARLGMSEANVKVAVHRMRQKYRDFIRAEIAETVAAPGEIDEEIRVLLEALRH